MYILYWTLAFVLSILLFVYCINTGRYSLSSLFVGIIIVTSVVSFSNGIFLFTNRVEAGNKQTALEELKTQVDFLLSIKEDNETDTSYQKILIDTLDKYNKKVNYCRKEQESKMYGAFMNWDFCYDYEPIEYDLSIQNISTK